MNRADNRGFTLIELMLSMAFISIMLIAIALCVIQISQIYDRGLTLKEVNQAGRLVTGELQKSINSASPFAIEGSDSRFILQDADRGARLCLGTDSYIINFAEALDDSSGLSAVNTYAGTTGSGRPPIHMVKIEDSSYFYCRPGGDGTYPAIDGSKAVELLDAGDRELAIHKFMIISPSDSQIADSRIKQRLYTVSFILGTNEQVAIDDTLQCKPPAEEASNLTYCALNQFNVTVRAGNTLK